MQKLVSFFLFAASFAIASQSPGDLPEERVELIGKLHAGRLAVGGETTGATLKAQDGTSYELLLRDAQLAKRLDGKQVRVTGRLRTARGVEAPVRRIVDVGLLEGQIP